jgi:hypothetical protein
LCRCWGRCLDRVGWCVTLSLARHAPTNEPTGHRTGHPTSSFLRFCLFTTTSLPPSSTFPPANPPVPLPLSVAVLNALYQLLQPLLRHQLYLLGPNINMREIVRLWLLCYGSFFTRLATPLSTPRPISYNSMLTGVSYPLRFIFRPANAYVLSHQLL